MFTAPELNKPAISATTIDEQLKAQEIFPCVCVCSVHVGFAESVMFLEMYGKGEARKEWKQNFTANCSTDQTEL